MPKDAAANVADIDKALGVEGDAVSGEIASVMKSIEDTKPEVGKLEDLNLDELLK